MNRIFAAVGFPAVLFAAGAAFAATRTVTLAVEHMTCPACPAIVHKTLARLPGVEKVAVSLGKKTATVTYDNAKTTLAQLEAATRNAGYPSHPLAGRE